MTLKQQLVEAVIKRVYSLLNEGRNADKAKENTLKVIRNFFKGDADSLSRIDYIEKKLKDQCFHANIPDSVIRLEPIIMNIALSLGFEQANPDTAKLNRLFRIVNSLPDLQRNEMLPEGFQLNQLKLDNTTYDRLNDLFGSILDKQDAEEAERINNADYSEGMNTEYKILSDIDYKTANYYGDYSCSTSKLCYTQDESTWEEYTNGGKNTVYLLLHKNWRKIEEEHGEDTPYDDYGLSMIFVFVDEEGNIVYSNTRWNHHTNGQGPNDVDQSFTKEMLSNLLNANFDEVFKTSHTFEEKLAEAKQQLQNGADPNDVFDDVEKFHEGFAVVQLGDKYNFIDTNNKVLSEDLWFDYAWYFREGFANVRLEDKYNFINADGNLLRDDMWFDAVDDFRNGFAKVKLGGKINFINTNGEPISALWFDGVDDFRNGFAMVKLNNKGYNFINTNGELISDLWLDGVWGFYNGFARVQLGDKWNFIDTNHKILSDDLWFDGVDDFHIGFARVKLGEKINFIDTNGELISDLWFDEVKYFYEDISKVRLGNKWNLFDTNNKILRNDLWFDEIYNLYYGLAEVKLNKKYNFINTNGELISKLWFDYTGEFDEGFAKVKLENKWNFIKRDGNVLREDLWFDDVDAFNCDLARVKLGDKYNFINTNGEPISELWFDYIGNFGNSFAEVRLKDKGWNFIKRDGKLLREDLWFDRIETFGGPIPRVELDGKLYYIDTEGSLYDTDSGKLINKVNENRRRVVRLTESQLRNTIKSVITQYLNESRRR